MESAGSFYGLYNRKELVEEPQIRNPTQVRAEVSSGRSLLLLGMDAAESVFSIESKLGHGVGLG